MPKLSGFLKLAYIFAGGGLCSLALISSAFADSCDKLENNKTWNATFEKLNEAYVNKDYATALQYSRELESICELSPILNYTIAYIHKGLGDKEKYLFYLQKSTQNTERFSVDKNTLDQIWSDKYIAAHPDADPEHIKAQEETIINQAETINQLKAQLESTQITAGESIALQEEVNNSHKADDALLWTSIAIGGTGLILTAVGAVLVVQNKDKAIGSRVNADYTENYVKSGYPMAWGLVGAGIGVTVIGTALSGYFGYKYSKNHKDDNSKGLSFQISPYYSSVAFTF